MNVTVHESGNWFGWLVIVVVSFLIAWALSSFGNVTAHLSMLGLFLLITTGGETFWLKSAETPLKSLLPKNGSVAGIHHLLMREREIRRRLWRRYWVSVVLRAIVGALLAFFAKSTAVPTAHVILALYFVMFLTLPNFVAIVSYYRHVQDRAKETEALAAENEIDQKTDSALGLNSTSRTGKH